MNSIKTLTAQLSTIAAVLLVYLAHTYQVDGYGLAPMIAYPVATLAALMPWINVMMDYYTADYIDDYDHIVLEAAHCSECGQHKDLINGRCAICLHGHNVTAAVIDTMRAESMNQ